MSDSNSKNLENTDGLFCDLQLQPIKRITDPDHLALAARTAESLALAQSSLPLTLPEKKVQEFIIRLRVDSEALFSMMLCDPVAQKYSLTKKLYNELARGIMHTLESNQTGGMELNSLKSSLRNLVYTLPFSSCFHNNKDAPNLTSSLEFEHNHPPFEVPCISRALTLFGFQFGHLPHAEWNAVVNLIKIFVQIVNEFKLETVTESLGIRNYFEDLLNAHTSSIADSTDQRRDSEIKIMYIRWFLLCYMPTFCKSFPHYRTSSIFGRKLLCQLFPALRKTVEDKFFSKIDGIPQSKREILVKIVPWLLGKLQEVINAPENLIWQPNFTPQSLPRDVPETYDPDLSAIFFYTLHSEATSFRLEMTANNNGGTTKPVPGVENLRAEILSQLQKLKRTDLESVILDQVIENINLSTDVTHLNKRLSNTCHQRSRLMHQFTTLQQHVLELSHAVGEMLQPEEGLDRIDARDKTGREAEGTLQPFRFQRTVQVQTCISSSKCSQSSLDLTKKNTVKCCRSKKRTSLSSSDDPDIQFVCVKLKKSKQEQQQMNIQRRPAPSIKIKPVHAVIGIRSDSSKTRDTSANPNQLQFNENASSVSDLPAVSLNKLSNSWNSSSFCSTSSSTGTAVNKIAVPLPTGVENPKSSNESSHSPPSPGPNLNLCAALDLRTNVLTLTWSLADASSSSDQVEKHDSWRVESYKIYVLQQPLSLTETGIVNWKSMGTKEALDLPMSCTVSKLKENHRYHFTVRGIDVLNRAGPFSNIAVVSIPE